MRLSEGFKIAAPSATRVVCSLSGERKFREGFHFAFRTPIVNTRKAPIALSRSPKERHANFALTSIYKKKTRRPLRSTEQNASPRCHVLILQKDVARSVRQAARSRFLLGLLLDDPDFDLGMHIRVQADLDAIDSQRAYRLVELDLPLLDLESLGLELVRDVRGGD